MLGRLLDQRRDEAVRATARLRRHRVGRRRKHCPACVDYRRRSPTSSAAAVAYRVRFRGLPRIAERLCAPAGGAAGGSSPPTGAPPSDGSCPSASGGGASSPCARSRGRGTGSSSYPASTGGTPCPAAADTDGAQRTPTEPERSNGSRRSRGFARIPANSHGFWIARHLLQGRIFQDQQGSIRYRSRQAIQ